MLCSICQRNRNTADSQQCQGYRVRLRPRTLNDIKWSRETCDEEEWGCSIYSCSESEHSSKMDVCHRKRGEKKLRKRPCESSTEAHVCIWWPLQCLLQFQILVIGNTFCFKNLKELNLEEKGNTRLKEETLGGDAEYERPGKHSEGSEMK